MIKYDPLWKTLEKKEISQYKLINKFNFSPSTITCLKHNKNVSTYTIDRLCNILNCKVEEILIHELTDPTMLDNLDNQGVN